MYEGFRDIGRDIFLTGLISSHGGNLSLREGDDITITRRGSMLGALSQTDLVTTSMSACAADEHCSRELVVHRAIYEATEARAIAHTHSVHTVYRSLVHDAIEPIDSESVYVLGPRIPVVCCEQTIASPEAARLLAERFAEGAKVVVLRSHGPFAVGATLEEAFYHITCLEASCRLLDLRDTVGLPLL